MFLIVFEPYCSCIYYRIRYSSGSIKVISKCVCVCACVCVCVCVREFFIQSVFSFLHFKMGVNIVIVSFEL